MTENGDDQEDVEVLNADEFMDKIEELADSATAYYTPVSIRYLAQGGSVGVALLVTATRLERALGELTKDRFNLSDEEFDNLGWNKRTLGSFYNMCRETNVDVVKKYEHEIGQFISKRNDLAHHKGYFEEIEQNEDGEHNEVKDLILKMADFLEEADID